MGNRPGPNHVAYGIHQAAFHCVNNRSGALHIYIPVDLAAKMIIVVGQTQPVKFAAEGGDEHLIFGSRDKAPLKIQDCKDPLSVCPAANDLF